MTCIVGLIQDGAVYIGGDSVGANDEVMRPRRDDKVFIREDFIFGFTTSYRMGQIIRYSMDIPTRKPNEDVFEYMATAFVDALRRALRDGGFARIDSAVEEGGRFLVGHAGRIFCIDSDFQVAELRVPYAACGCGEQVAYGAMFASSKKKPRERIHQALTAAETFSAGVRRPFTIRRLAS